MYVSRIETARDVEENRREGTRLQLIFMKRQCMLKSGLRRRVRGAETERLAIRYDGERDMNFIGAS